MFWRKWKVRSEEYKQLIRLIGDLTRKVDLLEIDFNLLADKLTKAIQKRAIKKINSEKDEDDNSLNEQILPM